VSAIYSFDPGMYHLGATLFWVATQALGTTALLEPSCL